VSASASPQPAAAGTTSAAGQIFTTIGTASASGDSASAETGSSTNGAVSAVPTSGSNSVQTTVAVAGGVIGGVIALSIIAFIIWWWRRRSLKKRRSTLLTPLTTDPSFSKDEKGPYVINRGSIGPTPRAEKIRAAFNYNVRKIRGRMSQLVTRSGASSPSVNMNRGNSQFIETVSTHSRGNSSVTNELNVTAKDRFLDWWSRLTADMNFNWRLRNEPNKTNDAFSRGMKQKGGDSGSPDFLTLLGMDDGELDREAQRRRASISRKNGSASSADHFLAGLNLNFGGSGDDPFSDANASSHNSAKPAPLVVSQPNNPFNDSNAIREPPTAVPKPTTYVADIRRSRGQSMTDATTRAPSTVYGRESMVSVESFSTRRNKFRSDPFDLERPELLGSSQGSASSSIVGMAGSNASRGSDIRPPAGAHTRSDSFTSKYSSGVSGMSLADWSDPGPDIGPAVPQWNGPQPRESPTQGWRDRQEREAAAQRPGGKRRSGGSVGKAL
jgi:hypothetical protein